MQELQSRIRAKKKHRVKKWSLPPNRVLSAVVTPVLQKALPVGEAEEGLYVAPRPGCDVKPRSVPEAFGAQLCSEATSWASPAVLKEWLWQT